jgi:Tfp pilus assembly protein PilV
MWRTNSVKNRLLLNRKGFTLIEALLASFVMSIGLFAIGTAIYSQISSLNKNREQTIAALAAQEEIENIRGMPFDTVKNLNSSFTSSGFIYLLNPTGTVTPDNTYSPISGAADIRRVSVDVSWTSINGTTLHNRLVTLVTRNGIDKQ